MHRVDEMGAKIAASAEAVDHGSSHALSEEVEEYRLPEDYGPSPALSEQDMGDRLLEDEETTSSSSSVCHEQSPIWEIEDSDAPPCM